VTKGKSDRIREIPRVIHLGHLDDYKVILDKSAMVDKSAVTLWDLRRRTSPFSKKYVPGCNARVWRTEAPRGRWLFNVICSKPKSREKGWTVRLKVLRGKGRKLATRDVLVSCSCPAWAYWGADYNAFHNGYSEAVRARIDLDKGIRDPNRTYLICKHVYVVGAMVREWAVPYEFEGEKQYRRKVRPEPEVEMYEEYEVEEVEPGVPEVVRPRRIPEEPPKEEAPPTPEQVAPAPPEPPQAQPAQPEAPQEAPETPPEKPEEETEEEEDFPVYLL